MDVVAQPILKVLTYLVPIQFSALLKMFRCNTSKDLEYYSTITKSYKVAIDRRSITNAN